MVGALWNAVFRIGAGSGTLLVFAAMFRVYDDFTLFMRRWWYFTLPALVFTILIYSFVLDAEVKTQNETWNKDLKGAAMRPARLRRHLRPGSRRRRK